jgi:hypothetical protein
MKTGCVSSSRRRKQDYEAVEALHDIPSSHTLICCWNIHQGGGWGVVHKYQRRAVVTCGATQTSLPRRHTFFAITILPSSRDIPVGGRGGGGESDVGSGAAIRLNTAETSCCKTRIWCYCSHPGEETPVGLRLSPANALALTKATLL